MLRAQRVTDRAVELDLGGRHALGAELVLEPADREVVAAAVFEMSGHEVEPEPGRSLGRAFGPCEQRDRFAVDVRAEPLLAVDLHTAVTEIARGAVHGVAEIGTAVALGEEHRTVDARLEIVGAQPREQCRAHIRWRVRVDETRDATGHPGAAHESGVGLRHEVVRGRDDDARRRAAAGGLVGREAGDVPALPHRALRIDHRGMVLDRVDLVRPPVVAHELRRVGVDDVGVARDAHADERAELGELRFGPLPIFGRTAVVDEPPQLRVEVVPVVADRPVERRVVDHACSSSRPVPACSQFRRLMVARTLDAWRLTSPTCGSPSPTCRSRRARGAGSPRPTASSTSTSPQGSRSRPPATATRRCPPRSHSRLSGSSTPR